MKTELYRLRALRPGSTRPTLISVPRFLSILQPMPVVGESNADDTIILYIDGKEVARFLARDYQISDLGEGKIRWEYVYDKLIFPGRHAITISSINSIGAESESSPPQFTTVLPGSIKIGTLIVPTLLVLLILLILVVPLFLALLVFWKRRKKKDKAVHEQIAVAEERVHREMLGLEKEIKRDIEKGNGGHAEGDLRKVEYDIEKTIKKIDADEGEKQDKKEEKP